MQKWSDVNLVDATGSPITIGNPIPAQVVNQVGSVSILNSSTTPLLANGSFVGEWEDTLRWSHLVVQVYTDVASAEDGLEIEWSSDGINVDDTDNFSIPINNGKVFTFGPQSQYFRIRYINGNTNQTAFRLNTLLKPVYQKSSSHRITEDIVGDDDAELVKAVITGEDLYRPGNFNNARVNADGKLVISGNGTTLFQETWLNDAIDLTEKWTVETVGTGSYSLVNGVINLSVGSTLNSEQELFSQQVFQFPPHSAINFITEVKFTDTGKANNYRLFGVADGEHHDNGYVFALVGSSFYAQSYFSGSATSVNITSNFPTDNNFHNYRIHALNSIRVQFYIDDEIVATISAGSNLLTATKNFGLHFHNQNTGTTLGSSSIYIGTASLTDESQSSIQLIGASSASPTVLRQVKTDDQGRLITVSSAITGDAVTNVLNYDVTAKGPLVTNVWERVRTYTVPTNKVFNLISFQSAAANKTQISRCIRQIIFGTKNYATTYTQSNTLSAPSFASRLYAFVNTTHSATNTVLTATYTNQDGVAGRTATTGTIGTSAPGNTMYEFTLQGDDYGVLAVTAVSHTNALTGIDSIIGIDELGYHRDKTADLVTESITGTATILVPAGNFGTIGLDFNSTNTTVSRLIKAIFVLSE